MRVQRYGLFLIRPSMRSKKFGRVKYKVHGLPQNDKVPNEHHKASNRLFETSTQPFKARKNFPQTTISYHSSPHCDAAVRRFAAKAARGVASLGIAMLLTMRGEGRTKAGRDGATRHRLREKANFWPTTIDMLPPPTLFLKRTVVAARRVARIRRYDASTSYYEHFTS